MSHYFRILAFMLLAVLATTALAASAYAEPAELAAESSPATLDGNQPEKQVQVFTRSGKQMFCEVASFHAEAKTGDGTITVTPTYEECVMLGFGPATVKMNGCDYLLHLEDNGSSFTAKSDLACPGGKQVEILAYVSEAKHTAGTTVCEFTIGSQSGLKTIELTNESAGAEVTPKDWIKAHLEVEKITSKSLKNFLICGEETNFTGTLKGEAELKGTDTEGNPNGITVANGHGLHTEETEHEAHTEDTEHDEHTEETGETTGLTVEVGTVDIDGTLQEWVLNRGGRTFSCSVAKFKGHATNNASTFEASPTLESCESPSLNKPATVVMNGCTFMFHLAADEKEIEDTWTAVLDIVCPEGKAITMTIYNNVGHTEILCQYSYPSQSGKTTIDLTNKPAGGSAPKDWIQADLNLQGITSTKTAGSIITCGGIHNETITLTGTAQMNGTNALGEVTGVTVSTK